MLTDLLQRYRRRVPLLVWVIWGLINPAGASGHVLYQTIDEYKISLTLKEASLQEAFIAIEKKSPFKFIASVDRLNSQKKISLTLEKTSVKEALNAILKGTELVFTQVKTNIIITAKSAGTVPPKAINLSVVQPERAVKEVDGTVKDDKGTPLPGVNVLIKGNSRGTATNADGRYFITVDDENTTLVFSYIGYRSLEVVVRDRSVIDVTMSEEVTQIGEVIVTALGLEKDTRSVTYATQNITAQELNSVKDPNLINTLAGKTAGVVITKGSGGPGSSARVLLRGNKSITGNNQPLYVIDGIPMNNAMGTQGTTLFGATDGGDAISNLNPEDIESMQILKGASAAALYGSQAANGVILISTRKGKKGTAKIDFSSTATFENPIGLPQTQTGYGQTSPGVNDSWGAKITNGSNRHIRDFFRTGTNYLNSLSVSNGNDVSQFYISYANTKSGGIVPKNDLTRHNINLRGTTHLLNNKLTLDGSVNYIEQKVYNRPQSGFYYSPIFSLYLFPSGDDMAKYSGNNFEVWDKDRMMYVQNWPYIRNEASSNQNPYWIQNRNQSDLFRNRTIFSFTAKYAVRDWLTLQGRATYDKVTDTYEQRIYASSDPVLAHANGGYAKSITNNDQLYSDVLLTGTKDLNRNFFLSATVGFSNTQNGLTSVSLSSTSQTGLSYPNFFSVYGLQGLFNSAESEQNRLSQALFGTATLGYKETLFLDLTARNEWSSTIKQAFFYPSVGLSYDLTETVKSTNVVSFAKLRASYAEVGNALPFGVANLTPPYSLGNDENVNARGTLPYFSGTDTTRLKPERTRSYEFGTELKLFKNRLSVNLTYYNATTYDQVFQIAAPAGSGAANFWINGGTIRNMGVEAIVGYNAEMGGLRWSPTVNFSRNINQIRELSTLLNAERFVLTDAGNTRLVSLFLTRPKDGHYGSYGDLFGRTFQYNEDGSLKVDSQGLPVLSAQPDQYVGNANPKFLLGFNNRFAYKNLSLSFLIDSRFGGKVASITEQWLDFKGLSKRTGDARDNGGVMVNDKLIDAKLYYSYISGKGDRSAAAEKYMFDATNVRLRELALGYTLPKFSKAIKDINLSLVARNLFFFYKNAPFDPEVSITSANGLQGIEGFNLPATRSYGVTLRASF
ncbi:TonB-dependent receptor [Spirosoma humi]